MPEFHELHCTSSPGGLLFECAEGCGRRLVVDRIRGDLTVIDRGDPGSLHRGSVGGVELAMPRLRQR
jgi:hypothetical protein